MQTGARVLHRYRTLALEQRPALKWKHSRPTNYNKMHTHINGKTCERVEGCSIDACLWLYYSTPGLGISSAATTPLASQSIRRFFSSFLHLSLRQCVNICYLYLYYYKISLVQLLSSVYSFILIDDCSRVNFQWIVVLLNYSLFKVFIYYS